MLQLRPWTTLCERLSKTVLGCLLLVLVTNTNEGVTALSLLISTCALNALIRAYLFIARACLSTSLVHQRSDVRCSK